MRKEGRGRSRQNKAEQGRFRTVRRQGEREPGKHNKGKKMAKVGGTVSKNR